MNKNLLSLDELIEKYKNAPEILSKLVKRNDLALTDLLSKTVFLNKDSSISQRLFHVFNGINQIVKCDMCDKPAKFLKLSKGYQRHCSAKCAQNNKDVREKIKLTCLVTYGVDHPLKSEIIWDKIKVTCLEKYGTEHASQNPGVRDQIKRTCVERYGFENPNQNKEIREKAKQTCLEKYGVENPSQNDAIKEKKKRTVMLNYGEDHNFKINVADRINKRNNTCLAKYGVDNPSKSKEIRNKLSELTSAHI